MSTCCHCGRTLTYYQSVNRGCGSWCFQHRGGCGPSSRHTVPDVEPETSKRRISKGFAKAAIVGAALGVSCLLVHVVCIITAFIHHHYYFKTAATTVYSAMKNRSENDKHPYEQAAFSGSFEASSSGSIDNVSTRMGNACSRIIQNRRGISREWTREIGTETSSGMLEHGSATAFDWGSEAVIG